MAKNKLIHTKTSLELAKTLALKPADAYQWEVQVNLLQKLRHIIQREKLTHLQVAKKANTSRTRITSILNGNLEHVSTDLLIRILGSLGYSVTVSITRANIAA